MTHKNYLLTLASLSLALIVAGCSKDVKVPEPLPIAEVPPALRSAFTDANGETAETVSNLLAAVASNANIDALALADDLLKDQHLSVAQRKTAVRCQMGLAQSVHDSAEKGDQQAVAQLKYRHDTK